MPSCPGDSNSKKGGDTNKCKQRFKGVETFLRRLAFNLGNTPSQTEVKIISCIPIDVTDLQKKIVCLERQLLAASNPKTSKQQASVHTALTEPNAQNTSTVLCCQCSDVKPLGLREPSTMFEQCAGASSKARKSTVSFLCPTLTSNNEQNLSFISSENLGEKDSIGKYVDSHRKRFFRKCRKKTLKKKENRKTQLVYYAQTENSPFVNNVMSTNIPHKDYRFSQNKVDNALSKSYLANVIERHFDPGRVVEEFSDTSHFTSPVCRDFHSHYHGPYESDVCSCCHGHYQNVDKYFDKNQNFIFEPAAMHLHNEFNKNVYYDSNLYDIVPVKEKAVKVPKEDKFQVKEPKHPKEFRCWPEGARTKPQQHTKAKQSQTKMHTSISNYKQPLKTTKDNIKSKTSKYYKEKKVNKKTGPPETSKSFCIDCSEIYPKPFATHVFKKPETEPVRTAFRKNAECLTIDVDTKNLTIVTTTKETKTEETLNQIKSILQSVLAEVKMNPQANHLRGASPKKDVDVQKEPSQSNIKTCSSLLNSFTYNHSFNTNPYLPTCSRQIPSPLCYTTAACQRPNYTQNFPLLIQTPGHPKCGFHKNDSNKVTSTKPNAADTATNTEIDDRNTLNCEREKLIKEIYKSIALSIDSPKETSNSEREEFKSVTNNFTNVPDHKVLRSTVVSTSDPPKRDIQTEASMTPTVTVKRSDKTSLVDGKPDANRKNEHYFNHDSQSTGHKLLGEEDHKRGKAIVGTAISEHYSEELTTDDESEALMERMEDAKGNKKKGLFKRMLGAVKLCNKARQKARKGSIKRGLAYKGSKKIESDSDDYQTIYTEKTNRQERFNRNQLHTSRNYVTHRPVRKKPAQRSRSNRRSPYMEQEYRRRWNEQLMFQENVKRSSSERPNPYSPVYWQNYEARSAIVDHRSPYTVHYNPIKTVIRKVEHKTSPLDIAERLEDKSRLNWLKRHRLDFSKCGGRWKKLLLYN